MKYRFQRTSFCFLSASNAPLKLPCQKCYACVNFNSKGNQFVDRMMNVTKEI